MNFKNQFCLCKSRNSASRPNIHWVSARCNDDVWLEFGFYLISDGGTAPCRYRVRPPSFINLTVLEVMCLGQKVADVIVIFGSVDIVLGEVDR